MGVLTEAFALLYEFPGEMMSWIVGRERAPQATEEVEEEAEERWGDDGTMYFGL